MSGHTVSQGGENAGAVFPAPDATVTAPDFASVLAAHERRGIACTCMAWSATIHSNREWTFDPAGEHLAHVAAALHAELVAAQAEAWDEGYTACIDDGISTDSPNPYRAAQVAPTRVPSTTEGDS